MRFLIKAETLSEGRWRIKYPEPVGNLLQERELERTEVGDHSYPMPSGDSDWDAQDLAQRYLNIATRGPGTDEECVQFPSDLYLGPVFLTPDDLINPQGLQEPLVSLSAETIAGVETTHYTVRQASLDDWHDLKVDLWLDAATGAALRYDLRAPGPDPLFGAGEGVLSGQFLVNEVGPQVIEPITGCEIGLPLPPDATRLVRLPGLIAFESVATPAEITAFYQAALAEAGWEPLAEPQVGADAVLSSYRRGEQTLEINVETSDAGVHVELLLSGE